MLNITTFLDANACRLDKNVLYNPKTNEKYNSREILAITSEIARDLKNCSIKKGDRVLIYLNNSTSYLFSLFAIWRLGAIAIPTNRVFTPHELEYIIDDSQAKLMITDEDAKDIVDLDKYIPKILKIIKMEKFYLQSLQIGMIYVSYSTLQEQQVNQKGPCLLMEIISLQSIMNVMY